MDLPSTLALLHTLCRNRRPAWTYLALLHCTGTRGLWVTQIRMDMPSATFFALSFTLLSFSAFFWSVMAALALNGGASASASAIASVSSRPDLRVAILGGGINGVATAYYLTQMGYKPIIIERSGVAAAASGKAGGFLARNWGRGQILNQMHTKGFDLHCKLATDLGIESYRPIRTLSVDGNQKGSVDATWLDGVASSRVIEANAHLPVRADAAQVNPHELTTKVAKSS